MDNEDPFKKIGPSYGAKWTFGLRLPTEKSFFRLVKPKYKAKVYPARPFYKPADDVDPYDCYCGDTHYFYTCPRCGERGQSYTQGGTIHNQCGYRVMVRVEDEDGKATT